MAAMAISAGRGLLPRRSCLELSRLVRTIPGLAAMLARGSAACLAALQEQILAPRHYILGELLAAAAERGDVRPGALTPECIATGPALLRQHFIETGQQPFDQDIRLLVDNILIPMLRPAP
jgi:hypothetical protein